ncbi:hypothetical protein O181_089028 [Austropuccinia psidii MF-1]|uniref:Uncharacterized protein n=1 Tax=Austropuccinia psidii MF-1 TaxID=1389203 RepID=A0A9Q3ISQ2_9BASI|nr:hypothetical protein [Austropuccinia psidii MF-1]
MLPHPRRSQSIHSCGTLKIYLLRCPQPSLHLLLSAVYHAYAHVVPSQHASDTAPHLCPHHSLLFHTPATHNPYTPAALQDIPPMLPSTLLMPSPTCLTLFSNYHPYTLAVSSQHASDTAPHLCPHYSLCFCAPASSSLLLTVLTLPQRPQDTPLTLPLTPLTPNPLSATYHPYAQVLDP